jgi:hypothetical protein
LLSAAVLLLTAIYYIAIEKAAERRRAPFCRVDYMFVLFDLRELQEPGANEFGLDTNQTETGLTLTVRTHVDGQGTLRGMQKCTTVP